MKMLILANESIQQEDWHKAHTALNGMMMIALAGKIAIERKKKMKNYKQ